MLPQEINSYKVLIFKYSEGAEIISNIVKIMINIVRNMKLIIFPTIGIVLTTMIFSVAKGGGMFARFYVDDTSC